MTITVRHSEPSRIYFVSKLEVKVGEDVIKVDLDPQTTTIFAAEVNVVRTGAVEARAYCTLHGWSTWVALGEESTSTQSEEPSGGIRGFPLLPLGLGLVLFAYVKRGW